MSSDFKIFILHMHAEAWDKRLVSIHNSCTHTKRAYSIGAHFMGTLWFLCVPPLYHEAPPGHTDSTTKPC